MNQDTSTDRNRFIQQLNFWGRDASNESSALLAAYSLGFFDRLPSQAPGLTPAALAKQLGADPTGVAALLEPLVGLGLCRADGEWRVTLAPGVAEAFARPAFRAQVEEAKRYWAPVGRLAEAVRSGTAVIEGGQSFDVLARVRSLFDASESSGDGRVDELFDRLARNYVRTRVLIESGELGLLAALAAGPAELRALAARLKLSVPGLEALLSGLGQMGITERSGEQVSLRPLAAEFLGSAPSLRYFLTALPAMTLYWDALGQLDQAVRERRFVLDLRDPAQSERIYLANAARISAIFPTHLRLGKRTAELIQTVRSLRGARVLDVGTGSGVWGAAFAMTDPEVFVTYLDQAHVLKKVKTNLEKLGLLARAELLAEDCAETDYGVGTYDVVLLPQIIPAVPPEALPKMIERLVRALRPDGLLVVSGYVITDDRSGPMDALYFSLRRFMTNEGRVLSLREFRELVQPVGLGAVTLYPTLPVQDVMIAARQAAQLPKQEAAVTAA